HWVRAGLVVISIGLGVATWVATDALHRALDQSLREAAAPLRGLADLYVTNTASVYVDADWALPRLQGVPGVKRVDPVLIEQVGAFREGVTPQDKGKPVGEKEDAVLIGLPLREKGDDEDLASRGIEVGTIDWTAAGWALVRGYTPVLV